MIKLLELKFSRRWQTNKIESDWSNSPRHSSSRQFPSPSSDSKSYGIPGFCKSLNGFRGIQVKIHKIWGKFMDFQSCSTSIFYRISMSSMGGGGVDIFWDSPMGCEFCGRIDQLKCRKVILSRFQVTNFLNSSESNVTDLCLRLENLD